MTEGLYKKAKRLRRVNELLRFFGIVLCLYILLMPYFPEVSRMLEVKERIVVNTDTLPLEVSTAIASGTDYLSIPSIGVGQVILEAENIKQIHEKVWRRPQGSTPEEGSNTVLVAHRYVTIGGQRASTFYHLPKLIAGDMIYVVWKGELFTYRVNETKTVLPSEIEVEAPTDVPTLTLYTCTPLWTSSHRFVVRAELVVD